MDKYINGNLIKRILVFKTRKHPEWKHEIEDTKFLFWKRHFDYWYLLDPFLGTYSEKEMLETISERTSFYKDGIVYQKPHIILEFSERHNESIYFNSDEELIKNFMTNTSKEVAYDTSLKQKVSAKNAPNIIIMEFKIVPVNDISASVTGITTCDPYVVLSEDCQA